MTSRITSPSNPRVVQARKLRRASERARSGSFLIEGEILLREAIESGLSVTEVFIAGDGPETRSAESAARDASARVWHVSGSVLKALADTTTPQGIVAIVSVPDRSIGELSDPSLVVVLAEVRDPGNAGTLVRSAAAAEADAIVFPKGAVDPFAPKTVRAAAGALFKIPVIRSDSTNAALEELREKGLVRIAADARGGRSAYQADLTRPFALVLGNEAWGLPRELSSLIDERVTIPMPGPTESLNVGIAGSILLFEAVRQRVPRGPNQRALSSFGNG
ncbi:MAG: TrmH family RNA methyltransferase [Actinomycetota bacterium]